MLNLNWNFYVCVLDTWIEPTQWLFMKVIDLEDKYPNFEVGLKCIIMVF